MLGYRHTIAACHVGYVCQAIVNNFVPLLFLTFRKEFGLSLELLSALIIVNFATQLLVDLFSARFADRIGARNLMVLSHVFVVLGLVGLAVLPDLLPPFAGLCAAIVLYAIGGGLAETLVSPIVEACPTKKKSAAMSLLHSSYCWGSMLVILLSTVCFALFGIENWRMLSCIWAILPLLNGFCFLAVPIPEIEEKEERGGLGRLFKTGAFWLFFLLMLSSGAAEQAMSQWASAFTESGLKLDKTLGDVLGPCLFAALMGIARIVHASTDGKIPPALYLACCSLLMLGGYLLAALSPIPALALAGVGIAGFSVGALWPGVLSLAAKRIKGGGNGMFAFLALAGDMGCGAGPLLVGAAAGAFGDDLGAGILTAAVFPLILLLALGFFAVRERKDG